MANTYLNRTFTAGDPDKWTWSAWVKIGSVGAYNPLFSGYVDSDNFTRLTFTDSNTFNISHLVGGSWVSRHITDRIFVDTNAWYHIVVVWDTGNASEYERQKLYINGVEENSWSTETNCAQDTDSWMNNTASTSYCRTGNVDSDYFKGYMAHVHYCDGQALAPTAFGEFDSTSGTWCALSSPSVTYGTNGYFLKFATGALGTDSSGEENDMTVNGTLLTSKDSPDNNFCTMNPRRKNTISATYSDGNNTFVRTGTGGQMNGSMGVTKGKWYFECLIDDYWQYLGWSNANSANNDACSDSGSEFYGVYANATNMSSYAQGTNTALTGYTVMAAGQYISLAFDADNGKLYYGTNGVWGNSSDPVAETNPMLTSIPTTYNDVDIHMLPCIGQGTGSRSSTIKMNFGNGIFGDTALTGTTYADDAGQGTFKYDVPAGYYALCTKNLKTYG